MAGRFITFEGIDGAGKSSHIEPLAAWLRERGPRVLLTREPGGTPLAERLRELVLHAADGRADRGAAGVCRRRDHLVQQIEPALARGATVLCDRFTDATFAYQGGGRGFDLACWRSWSLGAAGPAARPDAVVRPAAATAAERRAAVRAPDRFESQDLAFFERVRAGYARAAPADPGALRASTPTRAATPVWPRCRRRGGRAWWWPRRQAAAALAGRTAGRRRWGAVAARRTRCCCTAPAGAGALDFALRAGPGLAVRGVTPARGNAAPAAGLRQLPPGAVARAPRPARAAARDPARAGWAWPTTRPRAKTRASASPAADQDRRGARRPSTGSTRPARAGAPRWCRAAPGRGAERAVGQRPAEDAGRAAAGTRLLLTAADPSLLLPTVRSRCQRLACPAPPDVAAAGCRAGREAPEVLLAGCSGRPAGCAGLAQEGVDADVGACPGRWRRGQAAAFAGWPLPRVVDALHKLCHDAMARPAAARRASFAAGSLPAGARCRRWWPGSSELARVARHDEHPWNEGLLLDALVTAARAAERLGTPAPRRGQRPAWIHWPHERPCSHPPAAWARRGAPRRRPRPQPARGPA
jgi:dTMP kinase